MEHLRDIIKIIKKKRIEQIDLIDNDLISNEDSLLSRFYLALRDDKVTDDQDALKYLYNDSSDKNQQNYRRLKSRLSRRVFNTLFFLDMNLYSMKEQYERIAYEQRRILSILHILKRNGAREATIRIIKDNYQTAQKYFLYDVLKTYDYELSIYYSLTGNGKKFKHYQEQYDKHSSYDHLVQLSTLKYYALQLDLHYKKGEQNIEITDRSELINQYIQELADIRKQVFSFETEYYFLRASLSYYEYLGNSVELLRTADEIIRLTTQKNFRQEIWYGVAILYKAKALISLEAYKEGLKMMSDSLALFNEGGLNWFTAQEFIFRLALHDRQMDVAEKTLHATIKHRSFKSKPDYLVQKWYIFKAYWVLMEEESRKPFGKSSLNVIRLFNDTPYYVNDKSGYFLAIRILEMTECIRSDDYAAYSDKCFIIKRYRQQFLDPESQSREFIITEMLLSIDKMQFKKKAIEEENKSNYALLKVNPDKILLNDYEIIPYYLIWEIIMDYID